jgi:biopolymer transport protein ExbB/TolQ
MSIYLALLLIGLITVIVLLFKILKELKTFNQQGHALTNGIASIKDLIDKILGDNLKSMSQLEDYLTVILEHFGKDIKEYRKKRMESIDSRLVAAIKEGKKNDAVKIYHDISGKGLNESKEYIDKLERKIGNTSYSGDTLI